MKSGKEIRSFYRREEESVQAVEFSPDGKYVFSVGCSVPDYFEEWTLSLWDMKTGKEVRTFSGDTRGIVSAAFSPDGRYVITSRDLVLPLDYVPDGEEDAEKEPEKILKVWDLTTGKRIKTISGPGAKNLALWDISTLSAMRIGYNVDWAYWPYPLAFSPDGKYALSCRSDDNALILWEVKTDKLVRSFSGHTNVVKSVAFSPDGRYILSASDDKTLKLWDAGTGSLLFTRFHVNQTDWLVVAPDGRFDGSPDALKLLHYTKDNKSIPIDLPSDPFYTPSLINR